jgi:hypothetical protein
MSALVRVITALLADIVKLQLYEVFALLKIAATPLVPVALIVPIATRKPPTFIVSAAALLP